MQNIVKLPAWLEFKTNKNYQFSSSASSNVGITFPPWFRSRPIPSSHFITFSNSWTMAEILLNFSSLWKSPSPSGCATRCERVGTSPKGSYPPDDSGQPTEETKNLRWSVKLPPNSFVFDHTRVQTCCFGPQPSKWLKEEEEKNRPDGDCLPVLVFLCWAYSGHGKWEQFCTPPAFALAAWRHQ